jgi:hypothetical protein
MSFCLECGTPLSPVTVDLQNSPTALFNNNPTDPNNTETETVVGKRTNFTSNFQQSSAPPTKNKAVLLLGGIGALLLLVIGTIAAAVIYNLIPGKVDPVTVKSTPTSTPLEKGKTPIPQVSFTPPVEPTNKASFTVYANQGWQLSNIDTVALEEFTTTAQGKIDVAGVKEEISANGIDDTRTKSRRINPEFPTGALLMRTRYANGKYSNVVAVNTVGNWKNYPDERGKIEFCINDNAPENNEGQFIVTVTLTKVPRAKK